MKRLVGENVYAPVYGVLQLVFKVGEIKEAFSPHKLDQDVDVALLVHLAPGDGAEEGGPLDPVLSQDLDYCVTHGLHLIGHQDKLLRMSYSTRKMPILSRIFSGETSILIKATGSGGEGRHNLPPFRAAVPLELACYGSLFGPQVLGDPRIEILSVLLEDSIKNEPD